MSLSLQDIIACLHNSMPISMIVGSSHCHSHYRVSYQAFMIHGMIVLLLNVCVRVCANTYDDPLPQKSAPRS